MESSRYRDRSRRWRLLRRLQAWLETPMLLLSFAWLGLFLIEIMRGLRPFEQNLLTGIWAIFIAHFLLEFAVAPHRLAYLRKNWLTVLALFLPALRVLRTLRVLSILRGVRGVNAARAFTSTKRVWGELKAVEGDAPAPEMRIAVVIAKGRSGDGERLNRRATAICDEIAPELSDACGLPWRFVPVEVTALENDEPRRPSDFLDMASLAMAAGDFDAALIVTGVPLISRRRRVEPGLASPLCRMVVLSDRKAPEGTTAPLSKANRPDMAALALHLFGHVCGLSHRSTGVMRQDAAADAGLLKRFSTEERAILARRADALPERRLEDGNFVEAMVFHMLMAARHPGQVLRPLLVNRAPLLPFALPSLATAAVAPTLLLIFTAEIWDAGLGMSNVTAFLYAAASIAGASLYFVRVQSLLLPRKEKRVLTEHLAVANVVISLSILLMLTGLFLMIGALMLVMELWIFPQDLMATWPTLEQGPISAWDKVRLAAFIATIGVTTGALAGGLDSRAVIQHFALFEEEV